MNGALPYLSGAHSVFRKRGRSTVWLRYLDFIAAGGFLLLCFVLVAALLNGFQFQVITSNLWYLMKGLIQTWKLAVVTFVLALLSGVILAIGRMSPFFPLRSLSIAYIEVFRDVPTLMVLFWVYFLIPAISGKSVDAYLAAILALTVCEAAYLADVVRAGVNSVPRGGMEAALSTGLTFLQTMRWVILPQALQNMIPSLVNQFVSNFKTTSLVYIIGVIEFFRAATLVNNREFKSLEIFTFAGVVYLVNCYAISGLAGRFERRLLLKRAGLGKDIMVRVD